MTERFEFAFVPSYRRAALLFGIRPANARVVVRDGQLVVDFGSWHLRTPLSNITDTEITGSFSWIKTAGPPHLSLSDRGITFATNGDRALCLTFAEPVKGIEPTGRLSHPNATLTVADPEGLQAAIRAG